MAVIEGGSDFIGNCVKAVDLRAGASLVIAGLFSSGVTTIEDIHHIERGYENITEKLSSLGADISVVESSDESKCYHVLGA